MSMEDVRNIVILGAGESGNGAALLAQQQGYDVFVSDYGKIKETYKEELEKHGIVYEENGHGEERILNADLVIKSPGIPSTVPIIKKLNAKGVQIISEIEFGYQFKGESKIIAITGSNGKTTTTSMVYHLMKCGGKDVSMVGNIGFSFSRQLFLRPTEWYVIEVSSFQLDDIVDFRPDVAVLTNITPDHLDRYDYQFENYAKAKFLICKNQRADDLFIINRDDKGIKDFLNNQTIKPRIINITMEENKLNNQDGATIKDQDVHMRLNNDFLGLPIIDVSIRGKHNLYNTMAAGISAMAAGMRSASLKDCFSSFEGLEHRIEYVASVRGVDFINDSKATNLNSVWYALESMERPTILILGGQDKGNDYSEIIELVQEKVKAIVCMGSDNAKIIAAFDGKVPMIADTSSAKEAVAASFALAEKGDVVLLSPGCASFDLFQNYEDRGRQFKQAVKEL